MPKEFEALVADRKGDIYLAQGKRDEAKAEYQKAWTAFDARTDYRRLVEIKLNAVGVDPKSLAPAARRRRPLPRPHHEFQAFRDSRIQLPARCFGRGRGRRARGLFGHPEAQARRTAGQPGAARRSAGLERAHSGG